jgi:phosphoglycerate dehydrogenase-like enzyme
MKRRSRNCARGGVIDEVALVKALDKGKVLFAGLDVFETNQLQKWLF